MFAAARLNTKWNIYDRKHQKRRSLELGQIDRLPRRRRPALFFFVVQIDYVDTSHIYSKNLSRFVGFLRRAVMDQVAEVFCDVAVFVDEVVVHQR